MAVFADKDDGYPGLGGDLDGLSAGYNNKLFNVIADSMLYGVDFDRFDLTAGIAQSNGFYNCTFNDVQDLFRVDCPNEDTYFKNCIFSNVAHFESNATDRTFNLDIDDTSFENCNFSNTNFGPLELATTSNAASEIDESDGTEGFNVNPAYLSLNSVAASYSGNYAVKSVLNISGQSKYIWYNFTAEVGGTYEVRFFAKKNVGTNQRITGWQNLNLTEGPSSAEITNEWEEYIYTAVATGSSVQLRFYVGSGTQAEKDSDFLIDNLTIKKKFGERSSLYDPEFFDEEGGIFRLTGSSKLIDQGISTSGVVYGDYINTVRPQGDHYDIGAFEYTGNNEAPVALLISPCNGDRFNTGESIRLEAFASDLDGAISKVEFKRGNTGLGTVTQAPYEKNIQFNSPGTYYVTAHAYDNENVEVQSESVAIIVEACESVYIADNRFEQLLINQGYDSDGQINTSICLEDALAINYLDIGGLGDSNDPVDLTGMERFENLETFKAAGAILLGTLDFRDNPKLKWLNLTTVFCDDLIISNNTDLEILTIYYTVAFKNTLLDLSSHDKLKKVTLFSIGLTGLNLKNFNNSNITRLDVQGSNGPMCIQVDDPVAAAGYSNWHKDSDDQYSLDCSVEWSNTTSLMPINDAFMTGNSTYNTNEIKAWVSSSRKGYLMYDLSSIDGEITKAELQFTVGIDGGFGMFEIFEGINDPVTIWDENSLNASNRPALGDLLGAKDTNYTVNSVHTIALDYTKIEKSPHYSLVLFQPEPTPQGNQFNIKSKEHVDNTPPTLIISYLPSSGTSLRARIGDTVGPSNEGMVFYPNPTRNKVYISGIIGPKKVTLMDLTGRVIFETTSEQHTATIDMQPYPSGMYLVKIKSDEVEKTFKVIKE